jgi:RNA polymerase sigma-70 factor (ECF subfamily)
MAVSGEGALLEKVQQGDLEAYGLIIQDYQTSVFNVCYRILGIKQEAEDLTQEAFIRAYRQIKRYDTSRPFGPWVRTLAANLCYNHLKKARPVQSALDDERHQLHSNKGENPEAVLEINQEHQALYNAVWKLPEIQRVALELRHFQDLTYQEMADVLNLPLNTVRSHLYRARQNLAGLLEENNDQ